MKKRKPSGFATFQEFADAIGWHRNSLRERLRIPGCPVSGKPPWKADDAIRLASWFAGWKAATTEPSKREAVNPKNLALDDYRGERTALARLERMEREGSLVRIEVVRQKLLRVAEVLRAANATLQRQFGHDAYSLIEEAILALLAEFLLLPGDAAPSDEHPRG